MGPLLLVIGGKGLRRKQALFISLVLEDLGCLRLTLSDQRKGTTTPLELGR